MSDLEKENERLKRIIAKELTENDELGSEFVYVQALREICRSYVRDLAQLRSDIVKHAKDTVWVGPVETAVDRITSILGDVYDQENDPLHHDN